jgi:hypothetical protein
VTCFRALGLASILLGCSGETGSGIVDFEALAGGQLRGSESAAYEFDTAAGYHVALQRAQYTIGAIYLNRARPILGAQDTACVLPGTYAAEVRSKITFDALSPELTRFPQLGHGTSDRALTGEVWLTGGVIDAANDSTTIVDIAGAATRSGKNYTFHGRVTIGQNRAIPSSDPATPGANPICKLRIITPIPIDLTPRAGGHLEVRVSPEIWLDRVDFSKLPGADTAAGELEIPDSSNDPVSAVLFQGVRSTRAYQFTWVD